MILQFVVPFALGCAIWVAGYVYGWNEGTKDTERRWHDAVTRKSDY